MFSVIFPRWAFLALACLAGGFACGAALAHPGGLDRSGCHHNRRTGDYHCHRAPAPQRQTAPSAPSFQSRSADGAQAYYPNCAAVRAAGRAPLLRGQAGYRRGLDRDGDGLACE
ncbi:excalibur calcium-binding domain-containing protein [Novosphingobium mangrovi (ex Hu et al. 2023)]|uniref:Excalibur calcium-binding domain-containing protein n=1 Tax=Novosphingobium mangrovi (ex Hu et al. 2023) TaxID=2930094 RepID=A0ABT0AFK6_9SPHN|nr:excalibur calcium-binding domain-containing protein [Novosphingobium mangrovi (ex Hu et al. 2023)]MCJ1961996.1 excalibur calcium-binding domain-containing protein [Novosphingobium mangrovi (ex Hu et al. 2023)]